MTDKEYHKIKSHEHYLKYKKSYLERSRKRHIKGRKFVAKIKEEFGCS